MSTKVKQYDVQSQAYTTTGTASAYELTIPKLDALYDELTFMVEFHVENDASATLNINSLGAIAIKTSEGNAVEAGDLKTTGRYTLGYDADTARFVVSEMVDSEVEAMIAGGGATISDIFTDDMENTGVFSDNTEFYLKHYQDQTGTCPGSGWSRRYFLINGKGAPIIRSGSIQGSGCTFYVPDAGFGRSISNSYSYIIGDNIINITNSYDGNSARQTLIYKSPGVLGTLPINWTPYSITGYVIQQGFDSFIGYDGTYFYMAVYGGGYKRFQDIGTSLAYVDDWVNPAANITFVSPSGIYYANANIMTKYDLITGVEIGQAYYGTKRWSIGNDIWLNINTTGSTHSIYKAF